MAAPPFTFTEQRNTIYYHNLRIYIAGADVTPWLTSQVTINRADRDGIGSATFNLSNQYRALEITQDNVVGNNDGSVSVRTTQAPGSSNPPGFRLTDPYLPEGRYSELAKFIIFSNKNTTTNNPKFAVQTYGPIQGVTTNPGQTTPLQPGQSPSSAQFFGAQNLTGGTQNYSQSQSSATSRYPFTVGSLVFHKYDPVRIFVQNPFSRGDNTGTVNSQLSNGNPNIGASSGDEAATVAANANTSQWTCEFAGYIDTKPFSQNYVNGESIISISCQDIRILMQNMRTQTNPSASLGIANANDIIAKQNSSVISAQVSAGFFNDLVAPFSIISHVLGAQTFIQSINFLLFGIYNGGSQSQIIPAYGTASGAAPGANADVLGGPTPLPVSAPGTAASSNTLGVQPSGQTQPANLGGVGRLTAGQTLAYDPSNPSGAISVLEQWNNIVNFGEDETYLTFAEMLYIGSQTFDGGEWAPDNQQVYLLKPASGTPQVNLVGYNADATGVNTRLEWATRLELIQQVCKSIDYQFYVTGMGDIVFEFPMYDFFPNHFNNTYNLLYSFGGHLIDDNVNDEGGSPISGLLVTSRNLFSEVSNNNAQSGGAGALAGVASSNQLTRTIFSNILASRVGMHIETHDLPGITDQNRLMQLGMIEFNKRLAEYNRFDMNTSYRPYIGVNRPIYHMIRKRLGITKTVSYTWRIREDVSLHMDLTYTRQMEQDGKFRFITGGEASPISYSKIYDSAYLPGQGPESSIGGPGQKVQQTATGGTPVNSG